MLAIMPAGSRAWGYVRQTRFAGGLRFVIQKARFYRHRGIGNEKQQMVAHLVRDAAAFLFVTHDRKRPWGRRKFGFREKCRLCAGRSFRQLACIVHIISRIRQSDQKPPKKEPQRGLAIWISKDKAKEDKYPTEKTDIGGRNTEVAEIILQHWRKI